jgi:8-oxo-dGTP pyrophosphatase MutT (NUDIX family)
VETALREIREETGLTVSLQEGFRHSVVYYPKPGVRKQVVYFLGEPKGSSRPSAGGRDQRAALGHAARSLRRRVV